MAMATWKDIARDRREEQDAQIPPEWRLSPLHPRHPRHPDARETIRTCGILTEDELRWTDMTDVRPLLHQLATGQLSSLQVTTAFCKRAALAQQLTKCLTEIFFDKALERAGKLDEQFAKTRTPSGPLHGLPVSIKDRFDVEGYDTTVGMDLVFSFSFSVAWPLRSGP
jgi:amidase